MNKKQNFLNLFTILFLIIFVPFFLSTYMRNGTWVYVENVYDSENITNIEIPIQIRGTIDYRGERIYTEKKVVEFCDVKKEKKEMKEKMKNIWKDMKRGCK